VTDVVVSLRFQGGPYDGQLRKKQISVGSLRRMTQKTNSVPFIIAVRGEGLNRGTYRSLNHKEYMSGTTLLMNWGEFTNTGLPKNPSKD
jgi:hypothetical protein